MVRAFFFTETQGRVVATEYVLLFCRRAGEHSFYQVMNEDILFILKDRPAWQKGRLNLPGGKVEPGETPEQAAIRELKEEAGYTCEQVFKEGVMQDRDFVIHVFRASYNFSFENPPTPRQGETERPIWIPWAKAKKDPRVIPNLKLTIPLMICGEPGWVITDDAPSLTGTDHTISVKIPMAPLA
jgi:8-oxo-dGTP pyrophosphatase MutT (NUDIX family)